MWCISVVLSLIWEIWSRYPRRQDGTRPGHHTGAKEHVFWVEGAAPPAGELLFAPVLCVCCVGNAWWNLAPAYSLHSTDVLCHLFGCWFFWKPGWLTRKPGHFFIHRLVSQSFEELTTFISRGMWADSQLFGTSFPGGRIHFPIKWAIGCEKRASRLRGPADFIAVV